MKDEAILAAQLRSTNTMQRNWALICVVLALGYLTVFALDSGGQYLKAASDCFVNTACIYVLGAMSLSVLAKFDFENMRASRIGIIAVFSVAFSLLWYAAVTSLHAWVNAGFVAGGIIVPFSGPAFRWQIFQGLVVALLLVLLAQINTLKAKSQSDTVKAESPKKSDAALLLRDEEEIIRVPIEEVVAITSAEEQVSVSTRTKTYQTRRTLKDLSERLPENFARIHRSSIVNLDHVVRLEPAGAGRLTAHLANGSAIQSSKQGARAIRELSI